MARNDGIDHTVARNQDLGNPADVAKVQEHNEREKDSYSNQDIVPERTSLNVHFKAPTDDYVKMFEQMEQDGVISTRGLKPDAVKYGELVFDVNSAYFYNHGGYEFAKQFYADAYKAAAEIVGGEQYILSAVMHADERNRAMSEALGEEVYHYHLHVVYIPVVEKQISTFIVDGQLNETAFYESLPLMDTDYWNKYKHYFVRKMDATSYTALNQLYEYVSEIQEQQMLMKAFQKNSFQITQNVLANIESQFIVADLNNACTGVTAQNITSAMENMIPQGVSEADRNTLNAMVQQIAAQNPNFDMNRFWSLYNQQRNWTKSIINQGALTSYTPVQIRISLEKMLKKYSMLEISGTEGYQMLKKTSKQKF